MCGHVGIAWSSALGVNKARFFEQALYADQLRGMDATGVALVDKDNNVEVIKRALAASDFLQTRLGVRAVDQAEKAFIAMGHNRATTLGGNGDDKAHPFEFDRVVGAHNGTIYNHRTIMPVFNHTVDSQNLIASIDKHGVVDILKRIHTGSYAIVLYDKEEQKMIFARNEDRPLHILQTDEGILWASEASMLWWVAARNNLIDKDTTEVQVPEHTVLTYDCNNMEFDKARKFSPKAPPLHHGTGGTFGVYNHSNNGGSGSIRGPNAGQIEGGHYDMWLNEAELKMAFNIETDDAIFVPHTFEEFKGQPKNTEIRGKVFGYLYVEPDACAYPCIHYNVSRSLYDEAYAEGSTLSVRVLGGHFTKEGNCVTLTAIEGKLDHEEARDLYKPPVSDLLGGAWVTGLSHCVALGARQKLTDQGIRKAYILKSSNRPINHKTLKIITLKNHKTEENVRDPKVEKENKTGSSESKSSKKSSALVKADQNVLPFQSKDQQSIEGALEERIYGPGGELVTPKQFSILTKMGCCICSDPIFVEDARRVVWIPGTMLAPVCPACAEDKTLLEQVIDVGAT